MIAACFAGFVLGTQVPVPTLDPGSFYGMRTYTKNAEFSCMPEKLVVGFAPANAEELNVVFLKEDGTEVFKRGVYSDETTYPAFSLLKMVGTMVALPEPGKYRAELQYKGTPTTVLPFEISRKAGGDEFNPTYSWDFKTPVDRMGTLSFSNSKPDSQVWVSWWTAPGREGIASKTTATMSLYHNGKQIASGTPTYFSDPHNQRFFMRMDGLKGFEQFRKEHLLKLNGVVEGRLMMGAKALRTFKWNVSGGKVKPIARSESSYTPRTDYWMPRTLAGIKQGYQIYHLEEQYWAMSE